MLYIQQNRRRDDRPSSRAVRFLTTFFIVLGVLTLLIMFSLGSLASRLMGGVEPEPLPKQMILTYTFKSGLLEKVSPPSLSRPSLRGGPVFQEIIAALEAGAKDKRVAGFAARIEDADLSIAQVQELRAAIQAFRASKKPAEIFTSDFSGNGTKEYYLASAFGKIWLQPAGALGLTGLAAEVPFARDMLDKIGVTASMQHRGSYKSAPESLTDTRMSAPAREAISSLVADLADQIATDISTDRHLKKDALQKIIDTGPYADKEALAMKLVDMLGYRDQMIEGLKKAAPKAEEVTLDDYAARLGDGDGWQAPWEEEARHHGPKIALITASGTIVPRASGGLKDDGIAADRIEKAFDEAAEDPDVMAVVLRLDTPGGSPSAAETIRRAIIKSREKGRPVIVSMGSAAASGGYWVASAADRIIAQPATLTGSIGVFGGKFVLADLWKKIGVNWEAIEAGGHARMFSSNRDFTEEEKARYAALLDNIYDSFVTRVMEGRKMSHENVLKVAEGRVWTGRQAKERGLVDELGGIKEATLAAKKAAKFKPGDDVPLERFPARQSPLAILTQMVGVGGVYAPTIRIDIPQLLSDLGVNAPLMVEQIEVR